MITRAMTLMPANTEIGNPPYVIALKIKVHHNNYSLTSTTSDIASSTRHKQHCETAQNNSSKLTSFFMSWHEENLFPKFHQLVLKVRANATNAETLSEHFTILEKTLKNNGLTNKPASIFNINKTGMPLNHKPLRSLLTKKRDVKTDMTSSSTKIMIIKWLSYNHADFLPV